MKNPFEINEILDFVFEHSSQNYCDAYVAALKILGEEPKEQWTSDDVIDAIKRANKAQTNLGNPR